MCVCVYTHDKTKVNYTQSPNIQLEIQIKLAPTLAAHLHRHCQIAIGWLYCYTVIS